MTEMWEPIDAESIFIKPEPEPVSEATQNLDLMVVSETEEPPPPPKKKRVLTAKQKEALAKGRERVRANREAKLKSSVELKQEQRAEKKEKKAVQLSIKEQRRIDTRKKKEDQIVEDWEKKKYTTLSSMNDMNSYNTLEAYLDTISREDILDKSKLEKKLKNMVGYLQKKIST